jgi:hypothetical protein
MRNDDQAYHSERAAHCRSMAKLATTDDVRRRHEELAALHAGLATTVREATPAPQAALA